MAGRIRDDDIAAVRERTDIVKLVSGYLTLRRAGADSMVGLCPFHTEKSPSFSVSPSKGVYHCFGCGEGGDAIRFLRAVEHLDFTEAVERLARDAGVTLRYEGDTPGARREASRRQALHDANERACALYHETLLQAKEAEGARAYLGSRGIDPALAERFQIGFAPGNPDFLLRRLPAKGTPAEILVEAGLAIRDQTSGAIRDRFRGRITFPVHDLQGRPIGIGARVLPGDREDGPKYLNSPETPIYRKGETL
ncbi:MAG: DNA primase [Actinomycetota bacterium]